MVFNMNQICKYSPAPRVAIWHIIRLLTVSCIATFIWKGGLSLELTELVVYVLAACAHAPVCFLMYKLMFKRFYIRKDDRLIHNMEKTGHLAHLGDAIVSVAVYWLLTMIAFLWALEAKPEGAQLASAIAAGMCVWTAIEAISTLRKVMVFQKFLRMESAREF